MSDYGEDYYSDGDEWLYVEEEYTQADDLAEHALPSPPPTAYADEDAIADFDLFDYFNDIEYASDGYDEGNFQPHDSKAAKTGQKRKRTGANVHGRKKQKLDKSANASLSAVPKPELPPVVWRAQNERGSKPKMLVEDVKPFAFLKDWRTRLADTPSWATGRSRTATPNSTAAEPGHGDSTATVISAPVFVDAEPSNHDDEADGAPAIDEDMLLAALRNKLGAAGGPLSGMDEQTLLQFAMRMMAAHDDGDAIAGEMADNLLGQGEDEDDEEGDDEASAEHLAWLSRMRGSTQAGEGDGGEASTSDAIASEMTDMVLDQGGDEDDDEGDNNPSAEPIAFIAKMHESTQAGEADGGEASTSKRPKSPQAKTNGGPPTPPSSEANRSVRTTDEKDVDGPNHSTATIPSRKRKADSGAEMEKDSTAAKKQRAAPSFDAPTASSQARAVFASTGARSSRGKRPGK